MEQSFLYLGGTETSLAFRATRNGIYQDFGVFDHQVMQNQVAVDEFNAAYLYAMENNLPLPDQVDPIYIDQNDFTDYFLGKPTSGEDFDAACIAFLSAYNL